MSSSEMRVTWTQSWLPGNLPLCSMQASARSRGDVDVQPDHDWLKGPNRSSKAHCAVSQLAASCRAATANPNSPNNMYLRLLQYTACKACCTCGVPQAWGEGGLLGLCVQQGAAQGLLHMHTVLVRLCPGSLQTPFGSWSQPGRAWQSVPGDAEALAWAHKRMGLHTLCACRARLFCTPHLPSAG